MASNSGYTELADRPLFGETRHLDRISFIIIAAITTVFVLATFIGMFIFHHFTGNHLFLIICVILLLASHLCLAFWYRAGDLEPRFRNLLIYNTAVIVLFCISANLIIREKS